MNHDTRNAMHLSAFTQRFEAGGLSRWELGDLLGVHPHQLADDELKDLRHRPVSVIIELARHLDMHPADLVRELDAVLSNARAPAETNPFAPPELDGEPAPTDPAADAMTILAALATAHHPLTADALTRVLGWRLPRTHAALRHLENHPRLGGPMALRRVPPDTYTPCWTGNNIRRSPSPITTATSSPRTEPPPLHTVITLGHLNGYAHHPSWNRTAEHQLEQAGLIHGGNDPDAPVYASDDVLFSLRCTGRYSRRWDTARRRREKPAPPAEPPPRHLPARPDDGIASGIESGVADLTEYDYPPSRDDQAGR